MFGVPATWALRASPSTKEAGPIGIGGAGGCGSLTVERALSCETGDRGRPRRETPHQRVGGFGWWRLKGSLHRCSRKGRAKPWHGRRELLNVRFEREASFSR